MTVQTAPAPVAVEERHLPAPRRPRRAPASLAFGALVATAAVLLPLGYLVVRATERGWEAVDATLIRPRTAELIGRSVSLSATVTAISVVLGVGAAWLVTRTDLPARRFWQVAFALPLAIPSYVAAWAWIGWRPDLAGRPGATIVLSSISYPYVYLPVAAAMRRADPGLEDVARSLGYGPVHTFFTVTLRQVRIAT
ncbi:MAG: iron ABC transporter permease, partial [Actinobacteria bacterium]|nr:iron ABC transporter permease [Actinomycetota bacterium]